MANHPGWTPTPTLTDSWDQLQHKPLSLKGESRRIQINKVSPVQAALVGCLYIKLRKVSAVAYPDSTHGDLTRTLPFLYMTRLICFAFQHNCQYFFFAVEGRRKAEQSSCWCTVLLFCHEWLAFTFLQYHVNWLWDCFSVSKATRHGKVCSSSSLQSFVIMYNVRGRVWKY